MKHTEQESFFFLKETAFTFNYEHPHRHIVHVGVCLATS